MRFLRWLFQWRFCNFVVIWGTLMLAINSAPHSEQQFVWTAWCTLDRGEDQTGSEGAQGMREKSKTKAQLRRERDEAFRLYHRYLDEKNESLELIQIQRKRTAALEREVLELHRVTQRLRDSRAGLENHCVSLARVLAEQADLARYRLASINELQVQLASTNLNSAAVKEPSR